jgi:hypothetical protein
VHDDENTTTTTIYEIKTAAILVQDDDRKNGTEKTGMSLVVVEFWRIGAEEQILGVQKTKKMYDGENSTTTMIYEMKTTGMVVGDDERTFGTERIRIRRVVVEFWRNGAEEQSLGRDEDDKVHDGENSTVGMIFELKTTRMIIQDDDRDYGPDRIEFRRVVVEF